MLTGGRPWPVVEPLPVNSLSLNQTLVSVGWYENFPVAPTLTKGGILPKARSRYSPSSSTLSSIAQTSMGRLA